MGVVVVEREEELHKKVLVEVHTEEEHMLVGAAHGRVAQGCGGGNIIGGGGGGIAAGGKQHEGAHVGWHC